MGAHSTSKWAGAARRLVAPVVMAALFAGTGGLRQAPNTAPAATVPATAPAGDAVVIVTSVEGAARARATPDAPWKLIEVGMRLPQGAEIQTGQSGRVVCFVPPGREFIIDRLSRVTVLEAEQQGNRLKTDLLMEYGRTDLRVQKAGYEQDARIRSPGATASVRGTETSLYNQPPFAPELKTYTGVVDYRFAKRQLTVSKGGRSSGGRATAETALIASVVDPSTANARTNADAALITQEVSRGAVVNFNPDIQLAEIRGGAGAQTDAQLQRSLPGKLNFVLRWSNNVDVDIFVAVDPRPFEQIFSPNGATFNPSTILFPGFGLQTAPSGGRIPFNHRGGANGGQEICFWPDQFPNGVFGFSALNNSTTTPADVRFNAFLDGDKVPLYGFDLAGNLIRTNGIRRFVPPVSNDPLAPPNSESTIVPVPRSALFELIIPESPDETLDGTAAAPAPQPQPEPQVTQPPTQADSRSAQRSPSRAAAKQPEPSRVATRGSRPARGATKPQLKMRNR